MPESIYDYSIETVQGDTLSMGQFSGKKILLVNIATTGERTGQIGALQQLQNLYADSLVVIAFPSNSFGNEPKRAAELQEYWQTSGLSLVIAAPGDVKGEAIQPVYRWLTQSASNGVIDVEVKSDFQKYLLDKDGQLIGYFAGSVSPLDPQITTSIQPVQ